MMYKDGIRYLKVNKDVSHSQQCCKKSILHIMVIVDIFKKRKLIWLKRTYDGV